MSQSSESSNSGCLDLSGMRVLVVEDSWQVGIAVTRLLKALGAEVSAIDFKLRDGELAGDLTKRLHELGMYVIVTRGYTEPTGSSLIAFSTCSTRAPPDRTTQGAEALLGVRGLPQDDRDSPPENLRARVRWRFSKNPAMQ